MYFHIWSLSFSRLDMSGFFKKNFHEFFFFSVVACLTLATFWTHPSSNHRIFLGCLNLFILVFMLSEARARLPMAGSQLPLVGKSGYDLSRRDLYILTVQQYTWGVLSYGAFLLKSGYFQNKKALDYNQDTMKYLFLHFDN